MDLYSSIFEEAKLLFIFERSKIALYFLKEAKSLKQNCSSFLKEAKLLFIFERSKIALYF
jgi:hypothetical protein